MQELIADIVGYEGKYEVTATGRVFSFPNISRKGKRELKQEKIKKDHTTYRRVSLCANGIVKRYLVHQLVGNTFIKNHDNKSDINHIDNNGENNNVSNLEWCTHKENMLHSELQGRQIKSHKAGGVTQGLIAAEQAMTRLTAVLGDRLISTKLFQDKTCTRRLVTYRCKHCNNIYTRRADSNVIRRGGICRDCF